MCGGGGIGNPDDPRGKEWPEWTDCSNPNTGFVGMSATLPVDCELPAPMLGFPPLLMPLQERKEEPEIDLDKVERTEEQKIGDEKRKIIQVPVYFSTYMWHVLIRELEYLLRIQGRDQQNLKLLLRNLNEQLSDVPLNFNDEKD